MKILKMIVKFERNLFKVLMKDKETIQEKKCKHRRKTGKRIKRKWSKG